MSSPFVFPETQSTVLPDPSTYFSPNLLSSPLPTSSFFQNFVIPNGSQPEYIHPYLIKTSNTSLSASYPLLIFTAAVLYQAFVPDLTISSTQTQTKEQNRVVSSHSDLGVTLDIPSSNLRFFLSRGSPFITASVTSPTSLSITTNHTIASLSSNDNKTKHTLRLNNTQTWLIYTSSPINLNHDDGASEVTSKPFYGTIRLAVLPDSKYEATLDKFSSSYPLSGDATFENSKPFRLVYQWQKKGSENLLMLAHPLHVKLLSKYNNAGVTVLHDFKYRSIDGDLVGVVGDSWVLEMDPIPVTWYSNKGVNDGSRDEIVSALVKDVEALNSSAITTKSSYFYGKQVGRAARLALIAEEVSFSKVVPTIKKFLKETIDPWLDGTFKGNGFLYEKKWGGLVTKLGSTDSTADFGFGVYNDHHFHLGYFLYGIAVLAKIDPEWGQKYKPQAYSLVTDFMNLDQKYSTIYPRLRCFDLYKLHSWASGVTEFEDGRNQESTSEAVNAYYSAALVGLAYDDSSLVATGSTLVALEILAAQTWWHVKVGENLYQEEFAQDNRIVGILWANKRDSKLWWATAECRECRLGIQVLPLLPITETLFSDAVYVKELVEWTMPYLSNEGWKGMTYALQGIYDKETALDEIRKLKGFDDGNSYTNLLWWIHSR
ncbi:probable endo-1,3(4)-beta-glucanase ARB_01444 [Cajanus cajan]|uniref:glucan endo-1,3-beta-D-glucosidase n=1 Tax=Cajanus cajan TaxID=3821 RepID=A0A151TCI1_CAJCA|nr:probable endo-1,3(4)-beta-glucanase ARB_01444 [Cajanus cajan]KYP64748.1 Putative endo-1,3(4)-beta-glucanase 2 [Cajanus cajan]